MSDTSKVWIALDREDVEEFAGENEGVCDMAAINWNRVTEACRKALVSECCEVAGEVAEGQFLKRYLIAGQEMPEDFPEGPATLIVIAGERDG